VLSAVGLRVQDEQLYVALLHCGECTRAELAGGLPGWTSARVARVLHSLVERGLVRRIAGRPSRYVPVAPDIAVETLARQSIDQARGVQAVIPQLMDIYWRAQSDVPSFDFVEVITEDPAARVQRARRLIRSVNTVVRAFECPPFPWHPATGPDALGELLAGDLTIEREQLARGVTYRVIYDQEHFDSARWTSDVAEMLQEGEQGRVGARLPIKLILYDDWAAAIPIPAAEGRPSIGSIIVHRSPLLDGLSALFEAYWARAVPLTPDGLVAAADGSSQPDQRMVALMASGLTDEATARALGISRSTVQRRINELMQAAGVRTRFQLGLALARAGAPQAGAPQAGVPRAR